MKKEELITAMREIRVGLKSDQITDTFHKAWNALNAQSQTIFSHNVMDFLVEGTGNLQRFTAVARDLCDLLEITPYYVGASNGEILHHIATAKGRRPPDGHSGSVYKENYLSESRTLLFVEAHRRVVNLSNLLKKTLHAERPDGELLLEGIIADGGPSLDVVQDVLATVAELVAAYCESQGDPEKPRIEVSYLDLGSNYQIGIKVDAKAEIGKNLTKFLTEVFHWIANPRAYMRGLRADGITKEITVLADLKKRVDDGEITAEAAHLIAERLLGCSRKLADQHVFPSALIREKTEKAPVEELLQLLDETTDRPALPAPNFQPATKALPPNEQTP